MYTNADVTIYNRYFDKETRLDKYKRTVMRNVFFDEKKASNRLQSGLESADHVLVLIPFESVTQAEFVPYRDFKGAKDTFTLQTGDKIVKGELEYEIDGGITDLDKKYETFTITSVDTKDFGSPHMRHWEVGGK